MSLLARAQGASDQARTIAALVAMNGTLGASLGAGAVVGARRSRNLACGAAFDLGLALAGVRVRTLGAEHLEAVRPAIFAFNHQSNLDPLVVCKLVRHDFTSTGKAEVRKDPAAIITAKAIDAILIDRRDPEQARAQMAVAAARLRGGVSVLIAPEGTRRLGPQPGPYRTGVVHLALAASVPVVPIVLRNTGQVMPGRVIAPGTVDVCVLPPVDTSAWHAADARRHAAELRESMAATVASWPS